MKTSFVSTHVLSDATRRSILDMQSRLVSAQKEASTGRHADVGLALGWRAAESISLRYDHTRLSGIVDTNALVETRLDASQGALERLLQATQGFLESLTVAHSGVADHSVLRQGAVNALDALTSVLNTSLNGQYLFAGINTDQAPLAGYFAEPAPPSREAVAAAFLDAFGLGQSEPGTEAIAAADMRAFLEGSFDSLFDPAGWSSDWSTASDQTIRSRISLHETVDAGASANHAAFRKLAEGFTMVADLGIAGLNEETAQAIIAAALKTTGDGIGQLTALQASLGTIQQQVSRSSERISLQIDLLEVRTNALETVDPYEAATRVNSLLTQIETSYALTGRIQQLTLLNYL